MKVLVHLVVILIVIALELVAAVVLTYCLSVSRTTLSSGRESLNLIQLAIAMALFICPFDNLYIVMFLETFISILLALKVVEVIAVLVVAGIAAVLEINSFDNVYAHTVFDLV